MTPKLFLMSGIGLMAVETLPDASMLEKLGIVGLLALMVIVLWKQDQKRQTKMEKLIETSIATMTEVRDALNRCPHNQGGR